MSAPGRALALAASLLMAGGRLTAQASLPPTPAKTNVRTFQLQGVVKELPADGGTVVIAHEAVAGYMPAMTMPFKVKAPSELTGLRVGEKVRCRLKVTDTESWVEGIVGQASRLPQEAAETQQGTGETPVLHPRHPLLDYPFTNELGQRVRISDFRGQALAVTFFFTRCPIPDYCPRLSKNFEEASEKLTALSGGPTNWHFLSVTFDPEFDTPAVLKAYAERYHYDPKHWTFLTGPRDKISQLAEGSGIKLQHTGGFISHNFRTLIVNAEGHLQTVFPMGGNLSDAIVAEVLKGAVVSNGVPVPGNAKAPSETAQVAR
jgi:protein SCO1